MFGLDKLPAIGKFFGDEKKQTETARMTQDGEDVRLNQETWKNFKVINMVFGIIYPWYLSLKNNGRLPCCFLKIHCKHL